MPTWGQPPGIPATGLAMIASSAPARGCPTVSTSPIPPSWPPPRHPSAIGGFRLILTRDRARLIGYDQEAWARLARPPFAELVVAFTALRTANLVLIRGTPVTWVGPTGHPRGARADQLSLCHRDHRRPRPGPPAAARPDDHRAAALTIVYIPLHSSVGVPGFEPGAFGSQSRRANQAAPYPVALPAVS
jgi:hypothetical protein